MKRMMMMLSVATLMVALTATAAFAVTKYGTNYGDALYGTNYADTMYGYGGADLIYGYGGADTLYGGNEIGYGDKILGGNGNDRVLGEGGDDALYGEGGNDSVYGGAGGDLIVGGPGTDYLSGGPGGDQINAQDGLKDTINCGNQYDTVYYDKGLDVLQGCLGTTSMESRVAEQPPAGLFEHTGKVLVEHKGQELLVLEQDLKGHIGHGDHILDPTGRSSSE